MNTYLEGYLASVPNSEYNNIISFLEQHASTKLNMTDSELRVLLDDLTKEKVPATQHREAALDEKPLDTYNDFFAKASLDLTYLFKVIDALYRATDSYSFLSASYFSDIKSELDKLSEKISELKAKNEYDNNTIIVTESFKDTESFESYNASTQYLFIDRDGTLLEPVELVHHNADDMITLKVNSKKDLLHNQNGKSIGMIWVEDYRGIPIDTYATSKYAIDNSDTSYWDCTVLSKDRIDVPMDDFERGGAYIKFKLHLAKSSKISEISITPFSIYPVEISKILIGSHEVISSISNPDNVSADTMTFNIPPVTADEIEIVLRQKNYTYEVVTTNEKINEANELWNLAIKNAKESYLNNTASTSEYSDNDIYKKYMAEKEEDIERWNKKFIRERD